MLISSSFLSNAAWHTTQVNESADLAKQILPDSAPGSQKVAPHHAEPVSPPRKTPQELSQAKASSARRDAQADAKRAATSKEDAARTGRNAAAQRRHARLAQLKSQNEAQQADNSSKDQNQATPANQETEPSPFLAILGGVLPPGAANSASASANGHAVTSTPLDAFSSLSQMVFGSGQIAGLPGGIASKNLAVGENGAGTQTEVGGNTGVADKTGDAVVTGAAGSSSGARQTELGPAFDGAFAVKTQVVASGAGTVQAQKQAEVAFAARIAERTATGTALGLNDAQATIAASRFDAANTGGQSGKNGNGAPQSGEPNQTAQPDPYGQAAQEQAASAPGAAQADARPASGAQNGAARTAGLQPVVQQNAAPALESHVSTASTSLTAGTPVTATPSGTAPAAGNSGPAKAAADERAPQFLEPQNETNARAGETVRDISLKLTNQDQASVQVRLSERAGELHVSVRTPDAGLTRNLREGLSDLVGRLEQSGYRAETWRPADNASTAQDQGRENPSQQQSSQQQNGGGSGTDSRQQQNSRDQQQPGAHTPEWVGELESSLQRSNRSWLPSATR